MRVGFIGLGNIGMPMARHLVTAGLDVVGLDRDDDRTRAFVVDGGQGASDPAELGGCDVVCLAVPDDDTTRSTLVGSGLLTELSDGASVLLHSTLLPPTVTRLAQEAAEQGVALHDAPVSGGAARAETGDLTLMVGGEPGEHALTVLDHLGTTVRCGPVGAAAAVKLANQLSMLAALAALHEGLALTERYGVEEQTVLDVLATSTGASWSAENWGFFDDLAGAYDDAGVPVAFRPWSKDLWDVVATARQAEVSVPVAAVLAQVMPTLVEGHARRTRQNGAE